MNSLKYVWKPVGFTPLKIVEKFKEKFPEYKDETISYAGRLDPMAEGILVILIGEENEKREKYLDQDKEYESEIIFGIATDTFDSLGLIVNVNIKNVTKGEIEKKLKSFHGKQKQLYPPYSSKAVKGKPLFWWARQGRISEIEIPEREIEIYSIELLKSIYIKTEEMVDQITKQVKKINGDFRQREIMESWEKFGEKNKEKELLKINIKVNSSSGTYIRRIADDLGNKLDSSAFAYSIKRMKVGEAEEKDALKII